MAQRRMFSPDIVASDAFLEMPVSAQALYFQLGMFADDDGFVSPRKYMRMLGSSEDDLKILLGKRFLLPFQSGVVVVKHWKINNLVRKDWYRPTQYLEEKKMLYIKENGVYTDNPDNGTPLVNEPLTQVRLGKVSINNTSVANAPLDLIEVSEVSIEKEDKGKDYKKEYSELCDWLERLTGVTFVDRRGQYTALKRARAANIIPGRLKTRAEELWPKLEHKGMDWFDVVYSFNKKA